MRYAQAVKALTATLALSINISTSSALAESTSVPHSYPGGVAQLILEKQSDLLPVVKFGIKEPVIIDQDTHWKILIGLSLDVLPGEYLVYVKRANKDSSASYEKIHVQQKLYSLAENNNSKKYINMQHKRISDIEFENSQQPSLPLNFPATGDWNTSFGELNYDKRKETLTSQNTLYLEIIEKTLILAPQNAIVSKVVTSKTGTSTVYLDHGRGLYSIISGIKEITVSAGNGVVAGAVLGNTTPPTSTLKKSSNYITWQSMMNGAYINPAVLTTL